MLHVDMWELIEFLAQAVRLWGSFSFLLSFTLYLIEWTRKEKSVKHSLGDWYLFSWACCLFSLSFLKNHFFFVFVLLGWWKVILTCLWKQTHWNYGRWLFIFLFFYFSSLKPLSVEERTISVTITQSCRSYFPGPQMVISVNSFNSIDRVMSWYIKFS